MLMGQRGCVDGKGGCGDGRKEAVSIRLRAMLVCQKICRNVWLVTCYVEKGWLDGGETTGEYE